MAFAIGRVTGRLFVSSCWFQNGGRVAVGLVNEEIGNMNFESARSTLRFVLRSMVLTALLLSSGAAQTGGVMSRREFERLSVIQRADTFERTIREASGAEGVDPKIIWAIAYNETRFRPWLTSKKDARGLMQFIPATAARFGLRDPYDPDASIVAAARYVKYLSTILGGRLDSVLAAYNAGEGTVLAYLNGKPLRLANKTINPERTRTRGGIPPYPETVGYVRRGLHVYQWLERRGTFQTSRDLAPLPSPASARALDSRLDFPTPQRRTDQNQEGRSTGKFGPSSRSGKRPMPSNSPGNDRNGQSYSRELVYYDPRSGNRFLLVPGRRISRLGEQGPVIVSPGTRAGNSGNARTTAVGAASKYSPIR